MMLQRVKKWIGINPPQPRPPTNAGRDDMPSPGTRKTLKKRHTRAVRRSKTAE